jgi:thiol:disulfide interchange protein DsbD
MKKNLLGFIAFLLLAPLFAHAVEEGDLLEPEKAFAFSAKALDANTLEVHYQIAEGYYLYHQKFKFEIEPKEITLGSPQIPPGKVKQDEFFGKVETHRGLLTIKLPLNRGSSAAQAVTLKATSQGCADVGVCYPPLTQTVKLTLLAAANSTPVPKTGGALAVLKDFGVSLSGAGDELLPPDEAFKVVVNAKDANTLLLTLTPSANVYLYRDKIKVTLLNAKGLAIDAVKLPKGEEKIDPSFGKMEVYHHAVTAEIALKRDAAAAQKIALRVDYQGCNEKVGVCYPPLNKRFDISLASAALPLTAAPSILSTPTSDIATPTIVDASPPTVGPVAVVASAAPATPEDEESKILRILKTGSIWLIIATFFVIGLGLSLTPCVFPMIPILSGIIAGQGQHITKVKGFTLAAAYVLGMAITYAIAGVIAGKSGALLSTALQNPWVLGTFALVFVILAFSMFGFFELQMPNFIQSRLTESSNKMHGGNLSGVFGMGILSALIIGPCVAAPLAGTLLFISQTGDGWKGGWALFAMALGMGVPLLAMGVGGGSLLPRAGAWMNAVKGFFGVLLLGVAIWLISPVVTPLVPMLLWSALLIISAIYLHALDSLAANASGFKKFWKGVGVIALITGVALAIGALSGSRDILQPLAGFRATAAGGAVANTEHGLKFERVKSVQELDARIAAAKGKAVMLDFYADWCVSCKEMERFTFNDPKVQARLKDTLLLQADVTANSEADKALLKRFRLFGPPGIIFFDHMGVEQKYRVIGYEPPEKFLQTLDNVLK